MNKCIIIGQQILVTCNFRIFFVKETYISGIENHYPRYLFIRIYYKPSVKQLSNFVRVYQAL